VLVRTGVTSKKDLWLYVLEIPVGNQGDISAQGTKISKDREVKKNLLR
jgi:hypothetical protein